MKILRRGSDLAGTRLGPSLRPSHAIFAAILAMFASVGISQPPTDQPNQPQVRGAAAAAAQQDTAAIGASFLAGQTANSGPTTKVGAAGEMIGFTNPDASGTQTITLVHAGKSWMAVYHIDRSGTIRLVSSRPIDADFSLQLNATSPLPKEIRELSGAKTR